MTALLAIFGSDSSQTSSVLVARMLSRMGARGGARAAVWREGDAVLAVSRQEWELGDDFSGPVLVVQDEDAVIVADASLYYRDDLQQKLAAKGVHSGDGTASHLILAAYHAFGERCPEVLEGDFSFVLWDRKARRVVAARDFMGRRPLFFAERGGLLIVASAIGAILEHPSVPNDLYLPAIAETTAGYVGASEATCYRAVSRLHAARTLIRDDGRRCRTTTHWEPPRFQSGSALSFDDAADHLRELLFVATAERLSVEGSTSVWMSGGRDSTAVFAAGQHVIRDRSLDSTLHPVSISYPPGDVGREDETIDAVAARWSADVRWIDIRDVPLLDRPVERAAQRDEPFAHAFESLQHALALETREAGAHVALDGVGGDQLFLLSDIHLADLFRTGRWLSLRREWRASGLASRGRSAFFRWAVQPVLPTSALLGAARLRGGRPLEAWLRRRLPEWVEPTFVRQHGLEEYARVLAPRRRGESIASTESCWYFTDLFFTSVFSAGAQCALEHGVEVRSPLYDRRIIEFAATRPRTDHVAGMDGKRLLRHAMRDLLPDEVTAPRAFRTGTPRDYTGQALHRALGAFHAQLRSSRLAELGMVNQVALAEACDAYLGNGDGRLALPLLLTLHAELWLRARSDGDSALPDSFEDEQAGLPLVHVVSDIGEADAPELHGSLT